MLKLALRLATAVLAVASVPCHAAWYQAKSRHFVIYSDDNPKSLLAYASRLERFDAAARVALRMGDPEIGDGNRLTVFVVPSDKDIRAIVGDKGTFIAGFYTGRVEGPLAYVAKTISSGSISSPEILFFHEYTHHLQSQQLDKPYPQWFVEGFAEFLSTAQIERDGSVWFGSPDSDRASGLLYGPQVKVDTLLAGLPANVSLQQGDSFYGRSWLLAHYLILESKRKGQLENYIDLLAKGVSDPAAAQQAFGDFNTLDRELDSYLHKPMLRFKIGADQIVTYPIQVVPLGVGASQAILIRARLKYGVDPSTAEAMAAQLRSIEAQSPGENLVESTLAEAELDAGHDAAAQAAADRALKANPNNTEALVLEGKAMEKSITSDDRAERDAAFEKARSMFLTANKLDTEDPEPLMEFYKSFIAEGIRPTENAIEALHYASDLAPQDVGVRMNSAIAYLHEGKLKEARTVLTVVAYSPHSGKAADKARSMIAQIDAGDAKGALMALRQPPN